MDDSDQDFVDLCSKLLKRVRKKPGEPRQPRKADHHVSTQASDGPKKKRNHKREGESASKFPGTQPVADPEQEVVCGGAGDGSGDAGRSETGLTAKDKVLQRMQQFKRASPPKLVHKEKSLARNHEHNCEPLPSLVQRRDTPESFGSHLQPEDSDEALALQLQQELDREAAQAIDLVDGGLFFCHICYRDLTRMTAEGRTQHVNRCLDESEESASAPPHPAGVPDCPICGKKFKSQKSRSAHLKCCSSEMGISPSVLLQALQRQAEEARNVPTANRLAETGGTKRKGLSKPGLQARKKPRKKTELLDEDTMVAMALSSSLLEQEKKSERGLQMDPAVPCRPHAGKGRGKKKKGAVPHPPPLLLVQDAEVALTRLQERVSALLLRSRVPSPPTPTRCPSSLPGWSGAAPLWQKSSLMDGASARLSDFYTPELSGFITPWESTAAASSSTINKSESSVQPASKETFTETRASIWPSSSQTGQLPVGSQVLQDLMELAEDGMTLTQCGYTASHSDKGKNAGLISNLHLSGFVQEESEEHGDLCASGFLPETTHSHTDGTHGQTRMTTDRLGAETERGSQSVALSRLASDLSSMVNNPQLSDVQIQVDSGEVYFAHSFMVYTRCPLLAEMVHESGFGVKEEGMPAAQRVLMSDVPGQAVFAFLHYLYTAHCSIPASLRPQVLELASRFDLKQLEQLCEIRRSEDEVSQGDEEDSMNQEDNVNQTDQAFLELLRSMWNEEDEDNEDTDTDGGQDEEKAVQQDRPADDLTACDREICEEKVNEDELEEIYEFAATQRNIEEKDSMEEEEVEQDYEDKDAEEAFTKLTESRTSTAGLSVKHSKTNSLIQPDPSLDRSYSRLFSGFCRTYEGEDPTTLSSTSGQPAANAPQSQKTHSPYKSSSKLPDGALHQSLASRVSDLSLRSPHSTSSLPVTGHSPSQVRDWRTADDLDVPKEGRLLKRESQGPCSVYITPDSPQKKKEPELIVLSDSSSNSPHSPCAPQNLQSYTQIKPQSVQKPNRPSLEDKKSTSLEFSPDHPSSPLDCSPEVSWLIPSTPLQHGRSTTSSYTQTRSSMCRTQLFPKDNTSSAPPSVFSSPTLPCNNRLQASSSPSRVSAHVGPAEDGVPRVKVKETVPCSSSFGVNFCPKRNSSCDMSEVKHVLGVPLSQSEHSDPSSSVSSKQDSPVHLQPQPCSSTPLHIELCQSPVPRFTSLLHSSVDKQRSSQGRERTLCDSPEKTDLGRFHLPSLPDPLDAPSSSHRALQSPERQSHSHQNGRSFEFSPHCNTGKEPASIGMRDERACENKDTGDEGQQETGVTESSFRQSFMAMDEPPIAFNDSWGLDVCTDADPGCFSLRLEDSGESSQQRQSSGQRQTARSSSFTECRPSPSRHSVHFLNSPGRVSASSSSKAQSSQARTGPSPPDPTTRTTPEISNSLLDSKIWDSWGEEEEDEALPLPQRVNPSAQLRTPAPSHNKRRRTLVPITPMPHFSDMDTPELKNKLNRFGVRPLPKRQMILKLKEIHHYTHQLVSSDSEDEAPSAGRTALMKPPASSSVATGNRQLKEPRAPAASSPLKLNREEQAELLSASQGSNTSSTAASEESERSNPELDLSSDGDSDTNGGISASQAATRLEDRLQAVRAFILSDSELYTQILQYQPLVLSQLQERLKAAGIRLGAAKLVDYLDSQCITFTTAKPGHSAPGCRRGKRTKAVVQSGASRKRGGTAAH